ncbi:MAG: hypothetical protein WDO74_17890 [Pseudomonadota bacterium]
MLAVDTHKIGTDLRDALLAVGVTADRIVVRVEPVYGETYVRVVVWSGGKEVDVHGPIEKWPPAASTARSLRWVFLSGHRAPLNGTVEQWVQGFRRASI